MARLNHNVLLTLIRTGTTSLPEHEKENLINQVNQTAKQAFGKVKTLKKDLWSA